MAAMRLVWAAYLWYTLGVPPGHYERFFCCQINPVINRNGLPFVSLAGRGLITGLICFHGGNMTWQEYIGSPQWAIKRAERLEIDHHRCVVCKGDGSDYRLEVHHLHYQTLGDENALLDLVTACSRCHPFLDDIRKARTYAARSHNPTFVEVSITARMENQHGMAGTSLQIEFIGPSDHAQRPDSRSPEQVVASDQEDFIQARQDRRGL
jgi:HNH endonuclease